MMNNDNAKTPSPPNQCLGQSLFKHIPMNSKVIENMNMSLFQEIKKRQTLFMKYFNAGDAQKAAQLYSPEGYFMPNLEKPLRGRGGIEEYFKKDMADGAYKVTIITEEVNGSGEWAFERGSYYLSGKKKECGVYLQVWKKNLGEWYIYNDCFTVLKHNT
uniref:DUF4440 domain-containing protein n=1 Tax=Parastrongyloides trichosuri TaxID=131310 RepID=A0A0N4ZJB9_PARTI